VLLSGARPGDVVGHAGGLWRAAAGCALLEALDAGGIDALDDPDAARLVRLHLVPEPPLDAGPAAALAGATAMLDVSDGLLRDTGRLARASGAVVALDPEALAGDVELVAAAARVAGPGPAAAALVRAWVLGGGEDHGLLATFAAGSVLPPGFRPVGTVRATGTDEAPRVLVGGEVADVPSGWDHFAPGT